MAKFTTDKTICIRVRLQLAWPEELKSLIQGSGTTRQAALGIRVEGSLREIRESTHHWETCVFPVEEGTRQRAKEPARDSEHNPVPIPSLSGSWEPLPGLLRPFVRSIHA